MINSAAAMSLLAHTHTHTCSPLTPYQNRLSFSSPASEVSQHLSPDQEHPLFPMLPPPPSSDGNSSPDTVSSASPDTLDLSPSDPSAQPWLTSSPLPIPTQSHHHTPHVQMYPGGMFSDMPMPPFESSVVPSERLYYAKPTPFRPFSTAGGESCLFID